jgi:hypothetical protein
MLLVIIKYKCSNLLGVFRSFKSGQDFSWPCLNYNPWVNYQITKTTEKFFGKTKGLIKTGINFMGCYSTGKYIPVVKFM